MLDEGYWESLLRDVEGATNSPPPNLEPSELPMEADAFGLAYGPRRAASGASAASTEADWERAQALLEMGEVFQVIISGYNRGGLRADVGSLQGFLPASHLLTAPIGSAPEARFAALAARVGDTLDVRLVEIDRGRCRLILSERLARQDDKAEALLASLQPGEVCRGTVTNLCPFGAFVDLGGFEGLIHISELSWGRVESAAEVLNPGDPVEVVVIQTHPEERKISLSLKRLRPDPWQGAESRYASGQTLDVVITNVVSFGAFARLEAGLEGLIHISELAEGDFMHPRNVVNEGDRVRVRVLHVDSVKRRIALTMRGSDAPVRVPPAGLSE